MDEYEKELNRLVKFGQRLCIPTNPDFKKEILETAHYSCYAVHPSYTKMYQDLKAIYCWNNMKRDISTIFSRCLSC